MVSAHYTVKEGPGVTDIISCLGELMVGKHKGMIDGFEVGRSEQPGYVNVRVDARDRLPQTIDERMRRRGARRTYTPE